MNALRLLVDLDCLWDTRLGTVGILDSSYAATLLNNEWRKRKTDQFREQSPTFKVEQYEQAYAKRDIVTLQNSVRTKMAEYLNDLIVDDIKDQVAPEEMRRYALYINTAPYNLDADDCEIIKEAYMELVPMLHEIHFVKMTTDMLTPEVLRNGDYRAMFTYHPEIWFALHTDALVKIRVPQCCMVCPELMVDVDWKKKLSKEELAQLAGWTPNSLMEMVSTEFLPIRRIPVEWFSACI